MEKHILPKLPSFDRRLEIAVGGLYNSEIDALRTAKFPFYVEDGSSKDIFDSISVQIEIRWNSQLAASGRVIPGPNGSFNKLVSKSNFEHPEDYPNGLKVGDLSRWVSADHFKGTANILLWVSLFWLLENKFEYALGATDIVNSLEVANLLDAAGFEIFGSPVQVPNKPRVLQLWYLNLAMISIDQVTSELEKNIIRFVKVNSRGNSV